jgi:ABC-type multidrug transport system fused ATPase/permease subunit
MVYPDSAIPAVQGINLEVEENSVVAFVGSSGAGKTTLVDLILGVLKPNKGSITISNIEPLECASRWSGAISYVPQNVSVIDGSIRENVTLGYPSIEVSDELVIECLSKASLWKFVSSLPEGMDTQVGDGGSRLSGGQKQRLGIARALLTNPKLLVLDEATSALDGGTEADITDAIYKLKGATTVIIIAHRLSTVIDADKVVYMQQGRIAAEGKFSDVRALAPDFDHQANLMGIK